MPHDELVTRFQEGFNLCTYSSLIDLQVMEDGEVPLRGLFCLPHLITQLSPGPKLFVKRGEKRPTTPSVPDRNTINTGGDRSCSGGSHQLRCFTPSSELPRGWEARPQKLNPPDWHYVDCPGEGLLCSQGCNLWGFGSGQPWSSIAGVSNPRAKDQFMAC